MSDPGDPRASATPYMRRLAASMARSGDSLRTLPGRLSRSLAPAGSGRRRRWRELGLLALALLPFAIAAAVTLARGGHGRWTVVQVQAAPWLDATAPAATHLRALVGERVDLARTQVRGPAPLACAGARYQVLAVPADGLFQGALAGRADAATQAAGLGLHELPASTVRVDCDNASFDFHRAGAGLVLLVDGAVLRLQRR
jgi:hypothetical protein